MPRASIGLGSNEGDPVANVEAGLRALESLGTVTARSALYRTKAWGVEEQADFINAAALLETELEPLALLSALKALEVELGRVATYRWGPRVIDLDILAYDGRTIREPGLIVPHERLFERAFALGPLAEIDPAYRDAFEGLSEAQREGLRRIAPATSRMRLGVNWDETLERVRGAAEFCASAGLARFRVEEDDLEIEVRRTPRAPEPPQPVEIAAASQNGHSGNGVAAPGERPSTVLKAEFVGIVRFSRPAVSEGTQLSEDRELAYVEALGIRNPIRAKAPGRVAAIYVSDGQAVEYGQPLFAIAAD